MAAASCVGLCACAPDHEPQLSDLDEQSRDELCAEESAASIADVDAVSGHCNVLAAGMAISRHESDSLTVDICESLRQKCIDDAEQAPPSTGCGNRPPFMAATCHASVADYHECEDKARESGRAIALRSCEQEIQALVAVLNAPAETGFTADQKLCNRVRNCFPEILPDGIPELWPE